MRIFKFGGASIKDAAGIRNVTGIIDSFQSKDEQLLVVISAIGKTTNKLESIVLAHKEKDPNFELLLDQLFEDHKVIIHELQFNDSAPILIELSEIKSNILGFISQNESTNYNFIYDQIVSKGELLSTNIIYHYLLDQKKDVGFLNAKNIIKTDNNYTDANIDWIATQTAIDQAFSTLKNKIIITQGFLGANSEMLYTTLGREGSDYTAAIIASCTHSPEITIWKDVNGVYTADPKVFPEATIVTKMSYKEAIEMTFYGASVIHPKTIKPIQNTNCILRVRSFINTEAEGTTIGNFDHIDYQPAIVLKTNQVLYSFSVRDFSFLNETNLGKIIAAFGKYSLRINLMQNTAIEFLVVTDEKLGKNERITEELGHDFHIKIESQLELMTIRHYNDSILEKYRNDPRLKITQKGLHTILYLMSSKDIDS